MTQQDKIRLINILCERCKVASAQLAQAVGQPQWLIDSTMQGKITNDVTVAAIVGRLLQIYRKKLGCDLEGAEKNTFVSKEQLMQWESGHKIDFDRVEGYLDNLEKYSRIKEETQAPSRKVFTQAKIEEKPVKVTEKSKKKSKDAKGKRKIDWRLYEASVNAKRQKERRNKKKWEESRKKALEIMSGARQLPELPKLYPEPSFLKDVYKQYEKEKIVEPIEEISPSDSRKRFGKLIWDMMQYIVHQTNHRKLTTSLAEKGFDTGSLLSMKDGSYDDINGYKIVAAYCLHLIGTAYAVSKRSLPQWADISYAVYQNVSDNPTCEDMTFDNCKTLFTLLKRYRTKYNSHGNDNNVNSISQQGHSIRHRSYSSNHGGFDYGITDT